MTYNIFDQELKKLEEKQKETDTAIENVNKAKELSLAASSIQSADTLAVHLVLTLRDGSRSNINLNALTAGERDVIADVLQTASERFLSQSRHLPWRETASGASTTDHQLMPPTPYSENTPDESDKSDKPDKPDEPKPSPTPSLSSPDDSDLPF